MPKILLCKESCRGRPALMVKATRQLWTIGTFHGPSLQYTCRRCGLPSRINALEFASLPDTPDGAIDVRER